MTSNMETQLAAAFGQFKKMSSTWTNHLSPGPLPNRYVDICDLFRGAFVRQSLLSGMPTFEHDRSGAVSDKTLLPGYRLLFSSDSIDIFVSEIGAVISCTYGNDTTIYGTAEQVESWKKLLGDG